jgi:hypothetical protein
MAANERDLTMSTFVLTEETSQTPVGDVLAGGGDDVIEIRDASGALVARVEREEGQGSVAVEPAKTARVNGDLVSRFRDLTNEWKAETEFLSSPDDIAMHPAYQQIIGLGSATVPLILHELEREPGHWFWALRAITGEDPVPARDRGRVNAMAAAWLEWGRERGLI